MYSKAVRDLMYSWDLPFFFAILGGHNNQNIVLSEFLAFIGRTVVKCIYTPAPDGQWWIWDLTGDDFGARTSELTRSSGSDSIASDSLSI